MNKKGFKTSEFLLNALITVGALFNQSGLLGDVIIPVENLIAVFFPAFGYTISRSVVKKKELETQGSVVGDVFIPEKKVQ